MFRLCKILIIFVMFLFVQFPTLHANETKNLLKQGLDCHDRKNYQCSIQKWEKAIKDKTLDPSFRKKTIKMLVNSYHSELEKTEARSKNIEKYSLRGLELKRRINIMNDIDDVNFNVKLVLYYYCSKQYSKSNKHIKNLKYLRNSFYHDGENKKAMKIEMKKWVNSVIYNVKNKKIDCHS